MKKSVTLFSGGIDSTTALYWALKHYGKVYALTFDYSQRHRVEVRMARKVSRKLDVQHKVIRVDLRQIGGSSLTDTSSPLPEYSGVEEIKGNTPSTYVPFRNGIFLSLAAAWAEVEEVAEVVCGFNVVDSPNYPDTRRQFVGAMQEAINWGTKASFSQEKIKIRAPYLNMKKSEIIRDGLSLGVDYAHTVSCYSGEEVPCGRCSSCILRQDAWQKVGMKDPLILRLEKEGKI